MSPLLSRERLKGTGLMFQRDVAYGRRPPGTAAVPAAPSRSSTERRWAPCSAGIGDNGSRRVSACTVAVSFSVLSAVRRSPGAPEDVAADERFWIGIQQAFTMDRSIVNLNNGGVSPSPAVVQEAMKRHLDFSNSAPPATPSGTEEHYRTLQQHKRTLSNATGTFVSSPGSFATAKRTFPSRQRSFPQPVRTFPRARRTFVCVPVAASRLVPPILPPL